MADIVAPEVRSRMMSAIRGSNTKPEITIRKLLHASGFRYRINVSSMPGKPDIVLRKHQAVIMVHGCFWHGHECLLFKWPKTRREFWEEKINGNRLRDESNLIRLQAQGWRVLVVWECALKGQGKLELSNLSRLMQDWIVDGKHGEQLKGTSNAVEH